MKTLIPLLLLFATFATPLASQENIPGSFTHQGQSRQYIVHLPPGFSESTLSPVVMVLHGGSGNMLNVQGFTRMNWVSNQQGFIAVYPQGIGPTNVAGGYSWADGRGTTADADGIDDVGFLNRLIDTLAVGFGADTSRIYICGFSNGGFMTQRLACESPGRFAAVGALGCSMDTALIQNCQPGVPLPMLYVSGTADPEVPYEGGTMSNPNVLPVVAVDTAVHFWAAQNGCALSLPAENLPDLVPDDNSTVERVRFTDCDCEAEVQLYRILNGGHTWPGVELPDLEPLLGETNEDINASSVLWSFFQPFTNCPALPAAVTAPAATLVKVFPNPTRGPVQIQPHRAVRWARVYNTAGQLLREHRGATGAISLADLPNGVYWLQLALQHEIKVEKLIKQ